MKRFESWLGPYFERYLAFRQGLGYEANSLRSSLRHLDRVVAQQSQQQWSAFNGAFFLNFRAGLHQSPRTVNGILSAVRGFFAFMVRQGQCEENPLAHLPACRERAYIPFVFSPEQTEELLTAVQCAMRRDSPAHFAQDLAVYLALVLIARLGLRLSEPLRLQRHHYRPKEASLYIERTKFKKDRLLPVPHSVARELDNYLAVRRALLADDSSRSLLVGSGGRGLRESQIYRAFHRALAACGITQPKRIIGNTTFGAPTVHSCRHSYAINTLARIRANGGSTQHALPVLAAFMGHRKYRYTALYLKVVDAAQRQALVNFAIGRQPEP